MNLFSLGGAKRKTVRKESKQLNMLKAKFGWITGMHLFTFLMVIAMFFSMYLAFTQDMGISELRQNKDDLKTELSDKETTLRDKTEAIVIFNKKLKDINKKFIPPRDEFGVYKLIIELDRLKARYPFQYRIVDNEKSLTSIYKFYDIEFTIAYNDMDSFTTTLNKLTNKYYMGFVNGKYEKGKFVMKYTLYAYDHKGVKK